MSEARETRWRTVLGLAAALILIVDVAATSAAETPEPAPVVAAKAGEAPSSASPTAAPHANADRSAVAMRMPATDRSTAVALFAIALSGGDWRILMRD